MFIGIGVVLSTFYIFIATYPGWSELTFFAKANRFFMISFAVLLFLSYTRRNNFIQHKRLILLATLFMLEPILSRASSHLGMGPFTAIQLIWNTFFISFFIFNWDDVANNSSSHLFRIYLVLHCMDCEYSNIEIVRTSRS